VRVNGRFDQGLGVQNRTVNIASEDWARLLPLIDQALDVPEGGREAWLASRGLEHRLEAALRFLLQERHAIESDRFLADLPRLAETPAAQGRLVAGASIGPWRLLREIGRGGMSTVWLAERADAQMERQVAIKLPHVGPERELLAARLLRERNILAGLEHRNIARLYDVGVTEAGLPYLAMEHVQGSDLLTFASSRRLGVAQRLALFQQVLRAVQYAHSKLVLHRDLKPGNILVNEAGDVKLLDFGIAKVLAADNTDAGHGELTRAAGRALTPAYASPEQLQGEPLGTASDVYSLGVVLFELLTGERPYALARDSQGALEEAILHAEPRRPSQAWAGDRKAVAFGGTSARVLRRSLAGDLDVIVLTALQKVPSQRYPTADAMALDLRRHQDGESILARGSSRWVRLRKFTVRHAALVGAGAAVFAALAIGLGVAVWQGQKARDEAVRATAIKDFLVTLLRGNDLDQADRQDKRRITLQTVLERSAADLSTGLKGQPEVREELRGLVAGLLDNLDLLDASIPLRQQQVRDLAERHAPIPVQVRALRDLAESQNSQLHEARATLEQARALCQADAAQERSPECLVARVELGRNLLTEGAMAQGQAHVEAAASALMATPAASLDRAIATRALGELRTLQGRAGEADALQQRALAEFEALWGPGSTRLAMELRLYATQLSLHERFADAFKVYDKAWQVRVKAAGPEAISSAKLELEMGLLQFRVGQDRRGEEHILHAGDVMLASQGPERAQLVFNARRARAELYVYGGQLGLAGPALEQLDDALRAYDLGSSEASYVDLLRAGYLMRIGQFAEALRLLEHRRDITVQEQGRDADDVASIDGRRIDVLVAWGKLDDAAALARGLSRAVPDDVLLGLRDTVSSWPGIQARYAQVQGRPRSDQYVVSVVKACESMGIALSDMHKEREALPYFDQAIEALAPGYPNNPSLAALRARKAGALAALHDVDAARVQLALAEAALAAEPSAGPQFRRPVLAARKQVAQAMKKV